ncbi:MAG: hypothetical protein ICV78_26600 [Tolypothrix sp. Co-bin9]|nr:hypothetical protein [Tolypothrix sp. Co-bin9]
MKFMLKDYFNPNQTRIFTVLILTGILSVASDLTFIKGALGATPNLSLETSNKVLNDKQNWIYHTNSNERSLRLASANTPSNNQSNKLPASVRNAVLQAASKRLQQPTSQLRIIEFQQQTWKDGCLELANADEVCTQALVPGWRVVVGIGEQTLVYHTNQTGSALRLNEKASSSPLTPVRIPVSELPPPLDQYVVFRQISSGGFAGRTYETVLLKDGQLIQVRIGDANDSERSVRRVSGQKVQQFVRSLERFKFSKFKNLSYPAPSGSADFITYTLTSQKGTVQYNDISQNNLPKNLQAAVKAWNQLIASAK